MCTAISYYPKDHYFGRNLDLEISFGEEVVVMPRNFPFKLRMADEMASHNGLVGMATVIGGFPLFYDAVNDKGLGMAGLNFAGNAYYGNPVDGKDNIAPFEFIPWVLGQCASVEEARTLLGRINLVNIAFSDKLPLAELHWMIADAKESIVVESMKDGLHIYDNPAGVMTNNPPFDKQLFSLNNYRSLSCEPAENTFGGGLDLDPYSRGMGAMGLPGDLSSQSRFVKAAFTRANSLCDGSEAQSVSQFFHILQSVEQQRGCVHLGGDDYEITIYSACANLDKGIYYYTTYDNSRITAIDMNKEDLDGSGLSEFPLKKEADILFEN